MAFLARYAGVSPAEYDEMEPRFSRAFAGAVARLNSVERDFYITLAKFVAGGRMRATGGEVRG